MAKATPERSGDVLAGVAAKTFKERVAAQTILADLPLKEFIKIELLPVSDVIEDLIRSRFDQEAFVPISHLTVGGFREWLLADTTLPEDISKLKFGLLPDMVAAVSKLMSIQDMILVSQKCRVITKFRNTIGLPGTLSVRLQPNHPTDDAKGILYSIVDGLLLGAGDAVIGINPATDNLVSVEKLLYLLSDIIETYQIPTQSCVLSHVTTSMELMEKGAPVDLVFQSIGGTEKLNKSFGVDIPMLREANQMAKSLNRFTIGENVFYFETGQGSALSADAHHGIDQQTLEVRAYALAREFDPLLVNSVVGFIGPEYLFNGKQIIRAGIEDHFCGKLLGLPMGVDICYTNHADADADDMDLLLTSLGVAGCNYIMGIPGNDDIMLSYQSTSFHDALYLRQALRLKPSPEFDKWLSSNQILDSKQIPKVNWDQKIPLLGALEGKL